MNGQIEGLLLKAVGGLYTAETESGVFECKARGIFRKQNISPCVGDRVILTDIDSCTAVVDKILPRKNSIIRPPLANLDCMVFVISTCEPSPNLTLLDKFLAIAEYKGIKGIIAVTKIDLQKNSFFADVYKDSGAELIEIDYENAESYMKLYDLLSGKVSAFTGNTGVGKSTLLNHISSNLEIKTGEISKNSIGLKTEAILQILPVFPHLKLRNTILSAKKSSQAVFLNSGTTRVSAVFWTVRTSRKKAALFLRRSEADRLLLQGITAMRKCTKKPDKSKNGS